jgi:hypothetical protein
MPRGPDANKLPSSTGPEGVRLQHAVDTGNRTANWCGLAARDYKLLLLSLLSMAPWGHSTRAEAPGIGRPVCGCDFAISVGFRRGYSVFESISFNMHWTSPKVGRSEALGSQLRPPTGAGAAALSRLAKGYQCTTIHSSFRGGGLIFAPRWV